MTATETNGRTITEDTYIVFYGDHDKNPESHGMLVREGLESAQRSERL